MPSWSPPKPRLCPELHHIIIDFVATPPRGHNQRRDILQCALVNKSWNAYATRWLWRNIWLYMPDDIQNSFQYKKTCGILSALITSPQLKKHIHHLDLDMPTTEEVDEEAVPLCYARRPDFFALCQFLPPPASVALTHDFLTPEDGYLSTEDGATRMSRLLAPFFDSTVLTTLTFTGNTFPLGLLASTPNLIHLKLFRVDTCELPLPKVTSSSVPSLPFRLKSAQFSRSFDAVSCITSTNAQVFSELEVLTLFPFTPADWRRDFVQLLSLASGSLKELHIQEGGLELIEDAYNAGFSIDWIFDLRRLKIDFIFWQNKDDRWNKVLDILDERHSTLRSLEKLELKLSRVPLPELGSIFDAENRGWQLARKLLSPEMTPSLRRVSIRVGWCSPEDRDHLKPELDKFDFGADVTLKAGMGEAIRNAVKSCMPTWKGDRRNIQTKFSVSYYDEIFGSDDEDSDSEI